MDKLIKDTIIRNRKERIRELFDALKPIMAEIDNHISPFVDNPSFYIASPIWDCTKSPFGLCAYHKDEDRAMDNCIFCGQPYERK